MKEAASDTLAFVHADGAPLIVVPRNQLARWHGMQPAVSPPATKGGSVAGAASAQTDYERACKAPAFVSVLRVGTSESLVLANFTDNAAWLRDESGQGGTIVRLMSVDDRATFEADMRDLNATAFPPSTLVWRIDDGHLRLFNAASAGSDTAEPAISITIPPGTYEVRTMHYDVPTVGEAIVHRVVPEVANTSAERTSPPESFERPPMRSRARAKLQPGDILEIEDGGQYGYVAYVGHHFMFNDAVRVVPRAFPAPVVDLCRLFDSPGYVTFFLAQQAFKRDEVRKVGHCADVVRAVPKTLRYAAKHDEAGRVTLWNISGGGIKDLVATSLTEEQLQIPIAENWSRETLMSRIVNQWMPQSFE